jgi:hypothetical protein
MTLTFIGMFLIPLGGFLFLLGKNYLYYLSIFFIPFTATSLVNSASGSPLVAINYFIILLVIKELINILFSRKIKFPSSERSSRILRYIFLFSLVVLLTLLMPLIIDGDLEIFSGKLIDLNLDTPLYFSSSNIYKTIPLLLGFLFTYIVVIKNSSQIVLYRSVKIYLVSVFVISLWGWLQFLSNIFDINYPFFLFNSMSENIQMSEGINVETDVSTFFRITSVTQEPSHFSQIVLTVLPIFLVSFAQRKTIFSFFIDLLMFAIMLFILLFSTSSSGLISTVIMFFVFTLIAYLNNICSVRYIVILSILISFFISVLYFNSPIIQNFLNEIIFNKMESGSALERLYGITTAWDYFLQYPILGIGWGVATSHDLFVLLLANSGIIGLFSFFTMVFVVFLYSMDNVKIISKVSFYEKKYILLLLNGFIISFATYLLTCIFVEFTWYLSHFYFFLGILTVINNYSTNLGKKENI